MTDRHADFEALSAYVDGEAPEWAAHVADCPSCAASADALRAVAGAVAAPVEPAPAAVREAALSAALDGGTAGGNRLIPAAGDRRRVPVGLLLGAVAAMFLVIAGITAVLSSSGGSSKGRTTVAGPPLEAIRPPDVGAGAAANSTAGGPTADNTALSPPTDLGDVPDAATLLARARPSLAAGAQSRAGNAGASTNSGAASAATGAAGTVAPPATPSPVIPGATGGAGGAAVLAPQVAGTRPCEEQARARQPSLGPVVYFATARSRGAPAVVLGFSTGPDPAAVTLLMLAQDGCGELFRAVGP
jgi:hypothetical protein